MMAGLDPPPRPRPVRILVVDDERDNRELLDIILTHEGFLIETAAGGEEAIATVARERPDLILLDLMMPGMDGYQVTAKIKSDLSTKDIPIILVTAMTGAKARTLGLGAGADDFLAKPLDRDELVLHVKRLLRKSGGAKDGN
jgi:DNA-binding response OmpR family regulator